VSARDLPAGADPGRWKAAVIAVDAAHAVREALDGQPATGQWRVTLTITDPSEVIVRIMAQRLRDEWLGPGNPDPEGSPGVTVNVEHLP
jgi:hypothetical protein